MQEKTDGKQTAPLSSLIQDPVNARKHNERNIEEICRSLREFGQHAPLVVQRSTGRVLVGNGRMEAMGRLGWKDAWVVFTDDDNVTAVRRALADNRTAELADWDENILSELVRSLGEDVEIPGWTEEELAALSALNPEPVEGLEDPDEVPPAPDEPTTKPGDLWILGEHRLLCGDSTDRRLVERLLAGEAADLFLTDPPYNVNYEGKTKSAMKIANDDMDDALFVDFLRTAFSAADAVLKPGAVFYIWHADTAGLNFRLACRDVGWTVRQCLVWNKNSLVMSRQDYHWKHEPCLYGWKDGAGHLWASDRKQTTVLDFDRPSKSEEHPTMKPVALFEYQLLNNTKGKDLVLDLFSGSGTTVIACERQGRRARVMEIAPRYCDVAVRRWEAFTGKEAVLEKEQ